MLSVTQRFTIIESINQYQSKMFKHLKNGFIPHGSVSQKFESDQVRYEAVKLSAGISSHVMESGSGSGSGSGLDLDLDNLNKRSAAALAEVITTELLYYHQLGEIGCFLASAYSDEENQNQIQPPPPIESDSSDSSSDLKLDSDSDSECGGDSNPAPLCRSQSYLSEPTAVMPTAVMPVQAPTHVNQLSANLLIASGRVRQKILEIAERLGVTLGLLSNASLRNTNYVDRRNLYGLVLHEIFVTLGGTSDSADNDELFCQRRSHVIHELCEVSKMTWTLMNLCAMTNTFRFMIPYDPLFSTVKIDPLESVFGNVFGNRTWPSPPRDESRPLQCSPAMATCDGMFHHSSS